MSCLHFGLVPQERETSVRHWLLAHYREENFFPYTHQFLLEEIYKVNTEQTDREALDLIRTRWAGMAKSETGTCWEGFRPGENCHEAGAVPAYFLSTYVLGVRLDGPVAGRHLIVQPRLADLQEAAGTVVTELGLVPVQWKRTNPDGELEFQIEIPNESHATLFLPFTGNELVLILDNQTRSGTQIQVQNRFIVTEIGSGIHHGRLSSN